MNRLDFAVLISILVGIAAFGIWRTLGRRNLHEYFKGDPRTNWATIGVSVMATQASAITFISTPGQGYRDGLGFVQFYFGLPFALILISIVFLPLYRRLNLFTAYEYLGRRFDSRTRLLGAGLFLLQRGLAAGITIYAPAIILSTTLGWSLRTTILLTGILVVIYTVLGGSEAVNLTQKYQLAVIFCGMAAAFITVCLRLHRTATVPEIAGIAGEFGKLQAVDFSTDPRHRYTLWAGLLGGFFLQLSYFGADQSQVQRYLSGESLRESRLGLMFNALFKIPMQFSILLLGVLVFVFYQFDRPPVFFNQVAWESAVRQDASGRLRGLEEEFGRIQSEKQAALGRWLEARRAGDAAAATGARERVLVLEKDADSLRARAAAALREVDPSIDPKDSDFIFITFVLSQMPHGLIGLLIAAFLAAALSSKAAELNALGATTTVDVYRHLVRREAPDAHYVAASKWFTLGWGMVAIAFALFASLADNLIQAINIVGSIFYGVLLGLFLVAFFLRRIGGTAVFWAALISQALVLVLHFCYHDRIGYLWYNLAGCAGCVALSQAIQWLQPRQSRLPGTSE
ncbi:MAG: sodium:solute symporter [Verrucomicrobiota bacterium]